MAPDQRVFCFGMSTHEEAELTGGGLAFTFNDLLLKAAIDPGLVRLMRHQDQSADPGRTPFSLWRNKPADFVAYQARQSLRAERQLTESRFWAAFVVTPSGETLLADVYDVRFLGRATSDLPAVQRAGVVDKAGEYILFDLTPLEAFAALRGRVVVDWGSGFLAWIQRAHRQNKPIIELRRAYEEEQFPGFGELILNLSDVPRLPATWASVLEASRGVYLLTCPRTGEHYVGSATGHEGFLGRWREYFMNGHGGNVRLIDREPSNYRIAVLEVAGSQQSQPEILQAEQRWMRKLQGALNSTNQRSQKIGRSNPVTREANRPGGEMSSVNEIGEVDDADIHEFILRRDELSPASLATRDAEDQSARPERSPMLGAATGNASGFAAHSQQEHGPKLNNDQTRTAIPRFKNGDLVPNEELDIYPQTQDVILAGLPPDVRAKEEAEIERRKRLDQGRARKDV